MPSHGVQRRDERTCIEYHVLLDAREDLSCMCSCAVRRGVGVGVLYWERSRERRRGCDGEADWDTAR